MDIIERIDAAIKDVKGSTFPDGLECHCDPDVGATCEICQEINLLRMCKAEILRMRECYKKGEKPIERKKLKED